MESCTYRTDLHDKLSISSRRSLTQLGDVVRRLVSTRLVKRTSWSRALEIKPLLWVLLSNVQSKLFTTTSHLV